MNFSSITMLYCDSHNSKQALNQWSSDSRAAEMTTQPNKSSVVTRSIKLIASFQLSSLFPISFEAKKSFIRKVFLTHAEPAMINRVNFGCLLHFLRFKINGKFVAIFQNSQVIEISVHLQPMHWKWVLVLCIPPNYKSPKQAEMFLV